MLSRCENDDPMLLQAPFFPLNEENKILEDYISAGKHMSKNSLKMSQPREYYWKLYKIYIS